MSDNFVQEYLYIDVEVYEPPVTKQEKEDNNSCSMIVIDVLGDDE